MSSLRAHYIPVMFKVLDKGKNVRPVVNRSPSHGLVVENVCSRVDVSTIVEKKKIRSGTGQSMYECSCVYPKVGDRLT